MRSLILLSILLFTFSGCNAQDKLQQSGSLKPVNMLVKRAAHTSTLLKDGRVLITGGIQEDGRGNEISMRSAEIYDPTTGEFIETADMNEEHSAHNAVLLPGGRVLIAGGWSIRDRSTTVEIFDPVTNKFSIAGKLSSPRAGMTAVLLNNGNVLLAGGSDGRDSYVNTAEIYDPVTNTFTPTGEMSLAKYSITSTLLKDGRVLITGGGTATTVLNQAEIYDPATNKFTLAAEMLTPRYKHAAVILKDGNVLIVGGSDEKDWRGKYKTAEIYETDKNRFIPASEMSGERFKLTDAVAVLTDGKVLIAGGNKKVELYDPIADTFTEIGELPDPYYYSTATLLNDGTILIAGGYDNNIAATSSAWIYKN